MTFEEAKVQKAKLDADVKAYSDVMKQFPVDNMGLTPDHVRTSPEYVKAKRDFQRAFDKLRAFNKGYVKVFKKEILEERRNRYKG